MIEYKYEYYLASGPFEQWREETSQYQCYILFLACDMQLQGGCFYSIRVEDGKIQTKKVKVKKKSFCLNIMFAFAFTFLAEILAFSTFLAHQR